MIVVKLIGGLGNQLFQYAAGRALAYRHGVELKADISPLEQEGGNNHTKRHYALDVFDLSLMPATDLETAPFLKFSRLKWMRELQRRFPALFNHLYFAESGSRYQPAFSALSNNVYLDGYWQSEKYFLSVRHLLLKELRLRASMPDDVGSWLDKIKKNQSLSLHVRRGDYITLESARNYHGGCGIGYYAEAVKKVTAAKGACDLFVFSDDIAWCRANLRVEGNVIFVEHSGAASWDLFLMSACSHNIIANSSFSWWGAWLNTNPDKMVVMPENWLAATRSRDLDIVAGDWITLPNQY